MFSLGEWGNRYYLEGFLACGAQARIQPSKGAFSDDTGANGLVLMFCNQNRWQDTRVITIQEGEEGVWTKFEKCPEGEFIKSVRIKNEAKKTFSDNTGINGFIFQCGSVEKFSKDIVFNGPFGMK